MMVTPHPDFPSFYSLLSGPSAPPRVGWGGNLFRYAQPKYMSEPYRLTGVGSVRNGGRWNVKDLIPANYFSTDPTTAAAEADAKAIAAGWPAHTLVPLTRVVFGITLRSVLDLTVAATQAVLNVTPAQLTTCPWSAEQAAGREALTQAVGRAAFETYAEGLLVPSAQRPGGVNLVVFPPHLRPGSSVTAYHGQHIPFVHGL